MTDSRGQPDRSVRQRVTFEPGQLRPTRLPLSPTYPPFRTWKTSEAEVLCERAPINVYIHVPYCVQRCTFCYYKTVDLRERSDIDAYVEAICAEIELARRSFHLQDRKIATIYFGGGTPTVMHERHFLRILDCLLPFASADVECTVEADPLTAQGTKLAMLRSLGVNRLSLGIQSFSDKVVANTGRLHTAEASRRAVAAAQELDGWSLNIDLLSGMPGETSDSWSDTINAALDLNVDSITIYKLETYANTALFRTVSQPVDMMHSAPLPSSTEETNFMRHAASALGQAGYSPWSHFTFTRGDRHHYIRNLWEGCDCYGFGVSAYGAHGDWMYQNTLDIAKYFRLVEQGQLPTSKAHRLTTVEKLARDLLLRSKLLVIDLAAFKRRHGIPLVSLCTPVLQELQELALVTVSPTQLALTDEGLLYGDFVGEALVAGFMRQIAC